MIKVLLIVGRPENAEARQKAAEIIHGASPAEFRFHAVFFGDQAAASDPQREELQVDSSWLSGANAGFFRRFGGLARLIREKRFSVVHVLAPEGRFLSLLAAKCLGVPVRIARPLPANLPVYELYRGITAVSLSFDDGRGDTTEVLEKLLLPRGIPATLNISTGYVDGSCPDALLPSRKQPMTVQELRQLAANPLIEISMHGDCHLNTDEDVFRGRTKLLEWLELPTESRLGFASPGSRFSAERFHAPEEAELRNATLYLRTGLRIRSLAPLRVFCRKLARVTHLPVLYRIAYHDTVMDSAEGGILYSVPILRNTSVNELMAVIRSAVKRRGAVILMLHSVLEDTAGEDNWSWKQKKLLRLCVRLSDLEQQGKLCLCTASRLYELLQGKDRSRRAGLSVTASGLVRTKSDS